MALDFLLDVDFVNGQAVVDRVRIAGLGVEQSGLQIERIGQAMGRIDAHHQGPVPQAGKLQPGGRGQAGFSHASFTAEQKDAHSFILPCLPERVRFAPNQSESQVLAAMADI